MYCISFWQFFTDKKQLWGCTWLYYSNVLWKRRFSEEEKYRQVPWLHFNQSFFTHLFRLNEITLVLTHTSCWTALGNSTTLTGLEQVVACPPQLTTPSFLSGKKHGCWCWIMEYIFVVCFALFGKTSLQYI